MACTIEDLNPSEIIVGCTDPLALNFDQTATVDSGLCFYSGQTSGCTDPSAINYNPEALYDDCSCEYIPCPPTSAITISAGVAYYTPPPKPTIPSDPGPTVPPSPLETDKSLLPQQGSTITPSEPGTTLKIPSTFIPLSEFCCKEEFVGQPVSWNTETQQCELLGHISNDCPEGGTQESNGVLFDAQTGLPVGQGCCNQTEGYSWILGEGGVSFCVNDESIDPPLIDCELSMEQVIYVGDTVVYDGSIIIEPEAIEGCTDPNADNYNSEAIIDDGSCFYDGWNPPIEEDCVLLDSWTRGFVSDTPTINYNEDDSIGSNTNDPTTGQPFLQGTYLLTLNTSDVALAQSLQVGDEIEISGINEFTSSDPCYDIGINPYLNGTAKIAKLIYDPNNANTVKIVTDFNITPYVITTNALGFCVVQDTDGIACPVFLNNQETLGCTDDTPGTNPDIFGNGGYLATNYNPNATVDDGSCVYPEDPPPPPSSSCTLPPGNIFFSDFNDWFVSYPTIATNLQGLPGAPAGIVGNSWWVDNNGTATVCNQNYDYGDAFVAITITDQTALDSYAPPGENDCASGVGYEVGLSDNFWADLQNSCYGTYVNDGIGQGQDYFLPQFRPPVRIMGRDGFDQNVLWLNISVDGATASSLAGACDPLPTDADYCVGISGEGFIPGGSGTGGNKNAGVFVDKSGNAVPKSPVGDHGSVIPLSELPCGPENIEPEEPEDTNQFQNLSEDCCTQLGAELGWEYIDGVCYWNPPTPTTSVEFGLSENDILVEDTDCGVLEIAASFYFERPDVVGCEITNLNDVTASLVVYTGDSMDNTVIATNIIDTFNLASDGYCQWTNLSSTIANNFSTPFKVKLVLDGVNECCEYDIFVDDIKVNCTKQDAITTNNYFDCPGFKLNRVIDNKKSWVRNVETPINRVFAPSSDADLPWRYTNYLEQSGVYENDSRLVLNSKEVDLVFNMRRKEKPCPNGYTYNPNNDTCFKIETTCPSGFTLSGETCISGVTTTSATTVVTTINRVNDSCNIDLSVFDLLEYKKNFQNYWVKFIEQFIPATTIFVSGEKWSNRDNEICPTIEPCGYDNVFSKTDLGLKNAEGGTTYTDNKNNNKEVPVYTSDDDVFSEKNGDYGDNNQEGPIILPNFVGSFLKRNPSILDSGLLTLKRGELSLLNKGKQEYQNKFRIKTIVFNR